MIYKIHQDKLYVHEWHVTFYNDAGIVYRAVFSGQDAEQRAREYLAWKEGPSVEEMGGS